MFPASNIRSVLIALLFLNIAMPIQAFELSGRSWPGAEASFFTAIPGASGLWQQSFEEAMGRWNGSTGFRFVAVNSSVNACLDDFKNGAMFADDVCGTPFGSSTLAVTLSSFVVGSGALVETDILFNSAESWSVYDGPISNGAIDFRRVAVHELGHALGLDHETVNLAIMNPFVGNTFSPIADDIAGAAAIYGTGTPPSDCDDPLLISPNQTVNGSLQVGDCVADPPADTSLVDPYQITLPGSGLLTINMTSSQLDAFLILANQAATTALAVDDDSGSGLNARISIQMNAGTYLILANSATSVAVTGAYQLTTTFVENDTDGDGIVDSSDNCPLISNPGQGDFEGDFIGDPCDPDDDNDGMSDDYENQFGLNPQDDTDAGLDPDGDGFTNLAESEAGSDPFDQNSAPKRILVGLGSAGGGYAEQVSGFAPFANQQWPKIDWTKYNQAVGETRPALCDLDGDGNKELVLGMGSYPTSGGWLEIFDDATTGYAHLKWVRVPWGGYNQANGETYPACGDLDGDGRDELVIGLGPSGKGYLYLLDDALTGYVPLPGTPNGVGWLRVSWSDYSKGPGATHPAVGDMDGDGLAEIAIGLGEGGEGWVQLRDDASAGMGGLAGTPAANGWARVDWSQYNQSSGISWPAICDLDGDNLGELVLGLDQGSSGWLQVLDSPGFTGASGTPAAGGWVHSGFPGYYAEQGVTFPACGDLDGDGRDELVIGLDSYPQDGGRIEVVEDLIDNLQHKFWIRVNWNRYNQNDGSTRPAVE